MALLTFVYVQSDLFDVDADSGEYVNEMNEDTMTNMSLDVGQLHLNDLEDSDKYDSTGYGVSVSTGGSGTAYKGFRDKETDDIGINVGEGGRI